MDSLVRPSRPKRDKRRGGVKVRKYKSNTANGADYYSIAFIGKDADCMPYKAALKFKGNMLYFLPDPKGYSVLPKHGNKRQMVINLIGTECPELRRFVGEHDGLKFDKKTHLFYIRGHEEVESEEVQEFTASVYDRELKVLLAINSQLDVIIRQLKRIKG